MSLPDMIKTLECHPLYPQLTDQLQSFNPDFAPEMLFILAHLVKLIKPFLLFLPIYDT